MAHIIDGASVTAQWYYDDFPGGTVFPRLDKAVLHTTETEGWPGYSGGASAPNITWHPRLGQVRQHFPNNVSARALKDSADTAVRENRDNVWQCEIVAYSDKKLGDSVGGLWIGDLTDAHYTQLARILTQLGAEEGLPLVSTVTWKEGATSFYSGVRLSGVAFDAYRGILGHIHVSGNTHWDPGGFRWSKLAAKLTATGDDDMATPQEIWTYKVSGGPQAGDATITVLAEASTFARNAELGVVKANEALVALAAKVDALVAAPPGSTVVSGFSDAALAALADAVADEQGRRLGEAPPS